MAADINCYFCCINLSCVKRNNIVNIGNRAKEYRILYDLVDFLVQSEGKEIQPANIHEKLEKAVICNPCYKVLKKYADAVEAIEPIKAKMKLIFLARVSCMINVTEWLWD